MTAAVDIHAGDVTLEAIQAELWQHPLRLEEKKQRKGMYEHDVGNTPLMTASKAGNVNVVAFLLSLGANVEAEGKV